MYKRKVYTSRFLDLELVISIYLFNLVKPQD